MSAVFPSVTDLDLRQHNVMVSGPTTIAALRSNQAAGLSARADTVRHGIRSPLQCCRIGNEGPLHCETCTRPGCELASSAGPQRPRLSAGPRARRGRR